MKVALIDYGAGNLHSCGKALERALAANGQAGSVEVGAKPEVIAAADAIVLPGDGAFKDCRDELAAVPGLEQALHEAVRVRGRPSSASVWACNCWPISARSAARRKASAGFPVAWSRLIPPNGISRCRIWAGTRWKRAAHTPC